MTAKARSPRRHERFSCNVPVTILWHTPAGEPRLAVGRCLDLSLAGMRLEMPERVEARTVLSVRIDKLRVAGSASVRSCEHRGSKFVVGVELMQRLRAIPDLPPAPAPKPPVQPSAPFPGPAGAA